MAYRKDDGDFGLEEVLDTVSAGGEKAAQDVIPGDDNIVNNVGGMLVGAALHPLEWVPGEGLTQLIVDSEVRQGISDSPGAVLSLLQGDSDKYIIRGYRDEPPPNTLVTNAAGIPVSFSSLTNDERRAIGLLVHSTCSTWCGRTALRNTTGR